MNSAKNSPVIKTVKKVIPAVVSIVCSKFLDEKKIPYNALNQDFFGVPSPVSQQKKNKVKVGGGSGFIVDEMGIIFTNRHVIEDPNAEYLVVLQGGEKVIPEILAKDPIHDVAILKIQKENLPIVKLGNSSSLELGQDVIAIGNALGIFQNTVSTGIISGLARAIFAQNSISEEKTMLRGLIQTDAAINPGNSGGPLVDLDGKAIGINAAMVYGAENIGFALPINNAKRDLEELKEYGRIRQPFLGLRYVSIDKGLKEKFKLPVETGALVLSEPDLYIVKNAVIPGSPADKAGIKESDIIIGVADKKITEEQTLNDLLIECKIGKAFPLRILRQGKEKTVKITLAEKK